MQFSKDQMLKMYEYLAHVRIMGEMIVSHILGGRISGAIHPSLGQEAIVAGLMMVEDEFPDKIYSTFTHRQQAYIAKKAGLEPFLAEVVNRATGSLGGIAGEYHIVDIDKGMLPLSGVLGSAQGIATGYAWSIKLDGRKDAVVLCSLGDGLMSEGVMYESMNLASIHDMPILFVVENNGIAMATPLEEESPIEDLYLRAISAGMKGAAADGNDIEAVVESVLEGLNQAIQGKPNVIELKTVRWEGHYIGDKQEVYRDLSFKENLDAIDPVIRYEKVLKERGIADDAYFAQVKEKVSAELDKAFMAAFEAPYPEKEAFLNPDIVYADREGGVL